MIEDIVINNLEKLYIYEHPKAIAIAVSGGSDSIALMHLMSSWAKSMQIKIVILSVNHNLREESIHEISYVKRVAQQLGYEFHSFDWYVGHNKSALQERARIARYNIMSNECHALGIRVLLTAHHLDDMLENYLMRKSKSDGIFGLSYSSELFYNDIRILRPLHRLRKKDLVDYLIKNKIDWLEDQSNSSTLYERNRTRMQIATFSIAYRNTIIKELSDINSSVQKSNIDLIEMLAESVCINNHGFASINLPKLRNTSLALQIQGLNYLLTIVSGKDTVPRFRSIKNIINNIKNNIKICCTLHGCVLQESNERLLIFREKSMIKSINNNLDSQETNDTIHSQQNSHSDYIWDNRFKILNNISDFTSHYYIDKLHFDEYLLIKNDLNLTELAKISNFYHKNILFTLPVIKNLEKVVAIPHISYYNDCKPNIVADILFRPNFISRFTHFV